PGGRLDEAARKRVDEALKLAESLGAETKTLVGNDIPGEVLRFARFENVTQIVIGRAGDSILAEIFRRSLPHELLRRAEDIAVHIVTGREPPAVLPRFRFSGRTELQPLPYLLATLGVAAAVLIGRALTALMPFPNVSMIFLLAVLFPAVSFGVWPAIYASLLSFLAYNFFFIEPI